MVRFLCKYCLLCSIYGVCMYVYGVSVYCNIISVSLWCCSLLSEWVGACCGGMCVGSLPHCDRESRQRWSVFSLSSAAAGGVGAVFCTEDSIAGEKPSFCVCVCVCLGQQRYTHPHFVHTSSSGLSTESKKTPEWYFHLRNLTHSSVFHIFFSGTVCLLFSFSFYLISSLGYPLVPHLSIYSLLRLTVTLTHTVNSCPWSRPSWSQPFVPNLTCVLRA